MAKYIETSNYRHTPTDKEGKPLKDPTGAPIGELTAEVKVEYYDTLKEVQALPGYTEKALCRIVCTWLSARGVQSQAKKDMVAIAQHKLESMPEVYTLSFPDGTREGSSDPLLPDYREALKSVRKIDPAARGRKFKVLSDMYPDVEVPEQLGKFDEVDDFAYLLAWHVKVQREKTLGEL